MAYSNQFLKITWIFSIQGTDEIADTSLNLTSAPGWTGAAAALGELTTGDTDDMVAAYNTMMGVAGGRWADYSQITAIKVAAVGTNGLYLVDPLVNEFTGGPEGTEIGNPAQCTTVLSLRSGFSIGGGNYGRMFLPHFYMSQLTNSPFTDPGQAQALATAAATFLNDVTDTVNDSITATVFPAIMSQVGGGTSKGVTEVRVGNVTDTQRRRRNQLAETYFSADLA